MKELRRFLYQLAPSSRYHQAYGSGVELNVFLFPVRADDVYEEVSLLSNGREDKVMFVYN